jgi:hypothetical protein
MMPRKFVEKYGKSLPKETCLKTPNGGKWKLNLVKSDGKVWFEKGWKEFAEHHSLAHGHLLLFRYEKPSNFEVHIFEKSALETNYPTKRVEDKKISIDQGNESLNGENCRAAQKRKANSFEFGSSSCVKVGKSQKKSRGKKKKTDFTSSMSHESFTSMCLIMFQFSRHFMLSLDHEICA